jgi:hypothetical protein
MRHAAVTTVGLFLLCCGGATAQERLQPGLWATTTSMGGKPMGPAVDKCLTAQDTRSANGALAEIKAYLDAENTKNKCTLKDLKVAGSHVTIMTACDDTNLVSDMTYGGTTYEGTMTVAVEDGMKQVMTIKGQRKGACP